MRARHRAQSLLLVLWLLLAEAGAQGQLLPPERSAHLVGVAAQSQLLSEDPERSDILADLRQQYHERATDERFPIYGLRLHFESAGTLHGLLEVIVDNDTGEAWQEVYFQLLPNLLEPGSLTVGDVRLAGVSSAFGLPRDGSLLRIPLEAPLPPGGTLRVDIDYRLDVPESTDRNYGILALTDGTLSLAHGYPLLAVHDGEWWDLDEPAPHGDLVHARSALFSVEIEAPLELRFVTGGIVLEHEVSGARQRLRVVAGPVRDFYLAAAVGLETVEEQVGPVTVRGHARAEGLEAMEEAVAIAASAMEFLSSRYGAYPYSELDLVPITTSALGVEFPGIIALRRQLLAGRERALWLESTVVHEVVHQWFYGVVGNDQVSEPWLDESLTQYLTLRYYLHEYGEAGYRHFRTGLNERWEQIGRRTVPIGLPVDAYDEREYGSVVYGLGPLVIEWLAGKVERQRFDEALRSYVDEHLFAIATGEDLQEAVEESCECSVEEFFERWIRP